MSEDKECPEMNGENAKELNSPEVEDCDNANQQLNDNLSNGKKEDVHENVASEADKVPTLAPDDVKVETESEKRIRIEHEHIKGLLSLEIWELVVDKIKNPKDLESLNNSSTIFQKMLAPRKLTFLLPSVLKTLEAWDQEQEELKRPRYRQRLPEGVPDTPEMRLVAHFVFYKQRTPFRPSVATYKNLRLVSRSWCDAVDWFYQNHDDHWVLEKRNDSLQPYYFQLDNQDIQDSFWPELGKDDQLNKFRIYFEKTHSESKRNPFFGRNVTFTLSEMYSQRMMTKFVKLFESLLALYGHHIWYFTFASLYPSSRTEGYSILQRFLVLMPNLKRLNITCDVEATEDDTEDTRKSLESEILRKPVPTLKKLEILDITKFHRLIFEELIRKNGHISTLVVDQNLNKRWAESKEISSGYVISTSLLPNMKELWLNIQTKEEFDSFIEGAVDPSLTKLCLDFKDSDYVDWPTIFNSLRQTWGRTVQHFELTMPEGETLNEKLAKYEHAYSLKLNFPALKSVKFGERNKNALEYLLPLINIIRNLIERALEDRESVDGYMGYNW